MASASPPWTALFGVSSNRYLAVASTICRTSPLTSAAEKCQVTALREGKEYAPWYEMPEQLPKLLDIKNRRTRYRRGNHEEVHDRNTCTRSDKATEP